MMAPLVTVFFLLLFSGTTVLGHRPRKHGEQTIPPVGAEAAQSLRPTTGKRHHGAGDCDFLQYQDIERSQPTPSFTNKAYLNGKLVYQYDSESGKAKPRPEYENVKNWTQESQIQKQRGDFAWKNLQDIMNIKNDASDSHVLRGRYGCELCQNGATSAFWEYSFDGKPFIKFNKEEPAWIPEDPAANQIKKNWEEDPDAVNRAKYYLEQTCIDDLQTYRDHKNSN